jgi:hypothetical protein
LEKAIESSKNLDRDQRSSCRPNPAESASALSSWHFEGQRLQYLGQRRDFDLQLQIPRLRFDRELRYSNQHLGETQTCWKWRSVLLAQFSRVGSVPALLG